jgi:glutaminyl-peptide cyclotransferase
MMNRYWLILAALFALSGAVDAPLPQVPKVEGFTVVAIYPHDRRAFTEGLFYKGGFLYESTGLEGQSSIRKVVVKTGKVVRSRALPPALFGEGIVNWKQEIISLTWKGGIGLRWHIDTFKPRGRFAYSGEGWGLTQDGTNLIMSDGTPEIRFLDPDTFAERRRMVVTLNGQPLANLNELEWIMGKIFANIWLTNAVVVIDPQSGVVQRVIDMTPISKASGRASSDDVLNGIAYDEQSDRLWITGKNWPTLFELRPFAPK